MAVNLVLNQWVTVWSKSFSYTGFTGRLECQAELTSQDVSANKSTVHYWLGVYPDDYKYGESTNTTIDLTGATTWNGYLKIGDGTAGQSYTTLRNSTVTLSHNSDGTLTTTVAGSFSQVYYSGTLSVASSGQATLPTIPRAGTPTVSKSTFTYGETITVYTHRMSSQFRCALQFVCGSYTYDIVDGAVQQNSVSFDTSLMNEASFMAQLSNKLTDKSKSCTIRCTTYSGVANLGTKTCTVTMKVNTSNYYPTVSMVSVTDTNTTAAKYHSLQTQYINNVSKIQVQYSAGVYPSGTYVRLTKGVASIGDNSATTTFNSTTTGTFSSNSIVMNYGSTVKGTVTDARGTTRTATVSMEKIDYEKMTISASSVTRPVSTDSTIVLNISGKAFKKTYTDYSVTPNQSVPNSLTITTKYKLVSASSWTTGATYNIALTGDNNSLNSFTINQQLAETYDYTNQYDFEYTISDLFTSSKKTLRIYEGLPVFGWGKTHFDIFGNLHMHDRTNASTVANVSPLEMVTIKGLPSRVTSVESVASSANTKATTATNTLANIGSYTRETTSSGVSLASGTSKKVLEIEVDAGTYILIGTIGYASNGTGVRWNYLGGTEGSTGNNAQTNVSVPACSGYQTFVTNVQVAKPSSTTKYYLNGWQNSGSSLSCTGHIVAIRIK